MPRTGVKSKRTPAVMKAFCDAVSDGQSKRTACEIAGISMETYSQWVKNFPDFSDQVKKAENKFKEWHLKNIKRHSKRTWTASAWLLERCYPGEFKQKTDVTTNGQEINGNGVVLILPDNGRDKTTTKAE